MNTQHDDELEDERGFFASLFLGTTSVIWFLLVIGLIAGTAFTIGGFFKFADNVTRWETDSASTSTDGIVVLTGGAERIKVAMGLIDETGGQRLLITGVNPKTGLDEIANSNGINRADFDCCVDLDRTALDTIGNAKAASIWAEKNNYRTLLVVTSNLHMARSLMEFRRAMPEVKLVPHPVEVLDLEAENWYKQPKIWRALGTEYGKFILSHLRAWVGDGMVKWAANTAQSFIV